MRRPEKPEVSIGFPVYNGEPYVEEALSSLLNQSFDDFELIICDNASTDRTAEICRDHAAADRRIQYHRNPKNLGAAPNFNLTFGLSKAPYFKWAAADDIYAPEFLSRCVAALDENVDAVLAHTKTIVLDVVSGERLNYDEQFATDSHDRVRRFGSMVAGHKCFQIFGLIRRNELQRTPLILPFSHGDNILLLRLALLGRFVEVPEPLFFARRHLAQSMQMIKDRQAYAVWFDAQSKGRWLFPWWRTELEKARAIHSVPLSLRESYNCYRYVYWDIRSNRRLLLDDVLFNARRAGRRLGLG